jgi:hypothetical protein
VKAKFAYMFRSSYHRLENVFLKLCTLGDDGATAGNSAENHFMEF